MPCLLPHPAHTSVNFKRQYFGIKEVHRIEGAVPSLGSDMMLYDAATGELLALLDTDWITTMRTGAVAAVSAKALRKPNATTYGFVGLGNTARATLLCVLHAEPEKHFNVKLLRYKDQAEQFVARFTGYENVSFEVMEHIDEMASTVDVLVSCITSSPVAASRAVWRAAPSPRFTSWAMIRTCPWRCGYLSRVWRSTSMLRSGEQSSTKMYSKSS